LFHRQQKVKRLETEVPKLPFCSHATAQPRSPTVQIAATSTWQTPFFAATAAGAETEMRMLTSYLIRRRMEGFPTQNQTFYCKSGIEKLIALSLLTAFGCRQWSMMFMVGQQTEKRVRRLRLQSTIGLAISRVVIRFLLCSDM